MNSIRAGFVFGPWASHILVFWRCICKTIRMEEYYLELYVFSLPTYWQNLCFLYRLLHEEPLLLSSFLDWFVINVSPQYIWFFVLPLKPKKIFDCSWKRPQIYFYTVLFVRWIFSTFVLDQCIIRESSEADISLMKKLFRVAFSWIRKEPKNSSWSDGFIVLASVILFVCLRQWISEQRPG